jgi:DNA-binding NarL/FixJ family response regulator
VALVQVDREALQTPGPRVLVVGRAAAEGLFSRLDECGLRLCGSLADLSSVDDAAIAASDLVAVACTERSLVLSRSRAQLAAIARARPVVAVVPAPSPQITATVLGLGLRGIVASDVTPAAFGRALRAAYSGELAVPRDTIAPLARLLARTSSRPIIQLPGEPLTPRQRQIVELIAQGATDAEIAELLGISRSTAHKHVQNARRKANARTRSQLVARYNSGIPVR